MPAGTITAIRQQSNDPQRVNLFIDGAFALGISLNTLVRERLAVGVYLDEAGWERLVASEQADQALQKALRQIERRPRSIAEIRRYLQRKGFGEETCAQTIARLRELGLLDDADFASRWVANRRALRPRGARALRAELRQKGIAPAVIDAALAAEDDGLSESERAEAVARSVLPRYAGVADWVAFQRRLGGYLLRRGFAADLIRPLLSRLWQELHPGADELD
ncbi:regulatory protein RecX [Chloroflexus sp.]|uniref:regulatory protein RecX n=1 Tax=Chloroflexus sp. TaxID=1904827 RepID=UPI00298EFDB9|nr:RecX family transcriptional regulator [Chloroflexus sp.]MCS6889788.1 RecX family transcriptional regulator [Chloroflexus sp.]MDW8405288.1 RecX family transcriptional regulator [Chloroflexus sp.]